MAGRLPRKNAKVITLTTAQRQRLQTLIVYPGTLFGNTNPQCQVLERVGFITQDVTDTYSTWTVTPAGHEYAERNNIIPTWANHG